MVLRIFIDILAFVGATGVVYVVYTMLKSERTRFRMRHVFGVETDAFRQALHALTGGMLVEGNKVDVLQNGDAFFPAMLEAIENAEATISLETYIIWDGPIAERFVDALLRKAEDGVVVRVVVDDIGSSARGARALERLCAESSKCHVQRFHPVRWWKAHEWWQFRRISHRNHRRILVVDGLVAFTGGAGIAEVWTGNGEGPEHWRDTVVRVTGPVVNHFQAAFMEHWIELTGEILAGYTLFPRLAETGTHLVQVVKSSPTAGASAMRRMYALALACARKRIWIATGYFVPDFSSIRALRKAVRRGVDVRILVPGATSDVPLARYMGERLYDRILRRGVRIYRYDKTMMHSKVMLVDDMFVTVGTANFDNRSFALNEEINACILDEEVGREVEKQFGRDFAEAVELELKTWRKRPFLDKVRERVAYVLWRQF